MASELHFQIGIVTVNAYMPGPLDQVEAELNHNIVLVTQNVGDPIRNPPDGSVSFHQSAGSREGRAYFFMTCKLTFCMSTLWRNSGGNLVDLRSCASTLDAMVDGDGDCAVNPDKNLKM